jgi:hypothetical protein
MAAVALLILDLRTRERTARWKLGSDHKKAIAI